MTISSQSGARLTVSRRQRATPYTPRTEALGVFAYSVVNSVITEGLGL